jgi:hypothetical protein
VQSLANIGGGGVVGKEARNTKVGRFGMIEYGTSTTRGVVNDIQEQIQGIRVLRCRCIVDYLK